MDATIVDLRYKMKDVMRAIQRNETVNVWYRGKRCATLVPAGTGGQLRPSMQDHPFVGMLDCTPDSSDACSEVAEVMDTLRSGRVRVP